MPSYAALLTPGERWKVVRTSAAPARRTPAHDHRLSAWWPNLLLDCVLPVGLGLSAMFFIATQRATSARWSAGLRRVPRR
jgi:hypothetical protein